MNVSSYQLNHPKAYIGYTLALDYGGNTTSADELTEEYVTAGVDMARRGAQNLGLIQETSKAYTEHELTKRGAWVYTNATEWFGGETTQDVLETFDESRGARSRFVTNYPEFSEAAPTVAMGDDTIALLVEYLREIHRDRLNSDEPYAVTLADLYEFCADYNQQFADDLLIGQNGEGYRSAATYTLKNVCWHLGVLQSKGTQAKTVDPDQLTWSLEVDVVTSNTKFADLSPTGVEICG